MRKGYYKSKEKSIVEEIRKTEKIPESNFFNDFDPKRLHHLIQEALHGGCLDIGIGVMSMFLEGEVNNLCGDSYKHSDDRKYTRYGKQNGYMYAGGQRVPIDKPRVRGIDGKEAKLKTYEVMQDPTRFHESVLRHMLYGVSTRNYDRVIDHAAERLTIKKSSISESFRATTRKNLQQFMGRSLADESWPVVLLDGTPMGGEMMIVSAGINNEGKKVVLGTRQGDTENAEVVKDLLVDMKNRGLSASEGILFVIDGSKALAKGIRDVFGEQAYIQRCRVHKKRNVLAYLSKDNQGVFGKAIDDAYALKDYEKAKERLKSISKDLEKVNPDAATSMREGLEETCTVLRFNIPELLFKTLMSTNPLESIFSIVEERVKRVKNWQRGDMRKRWLVAALLDAESRVNRIQGRKYLPDLMKAMKDDQEKRFGKLDESKEVA